MILNFELIMLAAVSVGFAEVAYTVVEAEAVVELEIVKDGFISGPVRLHYFTLAGQAESMWYSLMWNSGILYLCIGRLSSSRRFSMYVFYIGKVIFRIQSIVPYKKV